MSISTTYNSETVFSKQKIPWVTILILLAIFWGMSHEISMSLDWKMGVMEIVSVVEQGNLLRRIIFFGLGLIGAVCLIRNKRNRLKINGPLGYLILFFLFWTFASIFWSKETALTSRRLVRFAMLGIGAVGLSQRFSIRIILLFTLSATGLYLLLGLFFEIWFGTFQPFASEYRFSGTLHPNSQGINCALLLLASITLAIETRRWKIFFVIVAFVAFIFLILTKSRTSFISVTIALFTFWSFLSSRWKRLALVWSVIVTVILVLLIHSFFPVLGPTIKKGALLGREDPSTFTLTGRLPLWKKCLSYASKHPILGYGYDAFWTPKHIIEITDSEGWTIVSAHSTYIGYLLSLGVVGLLTYILILILGIRRSFFYYIASFNTGYLYLGALLLFCALDGLLESAIVYPSLPAFLNMLALVHLAFQNPVNYLQASKR